MCSDHEVKEKCQTSKMFQAFQKSTGYTTQHSGVLTRANQGLSPGLILTTQTLSLKSLSGYRQAVVNTEPGKLIKLRK